MMTQAGRRVPLRAAVLRLAAVLGTLVLLPGALSAQSATLSAGATTVVVVRHAEKATDDARDPSLSDAGRRRAAALDSALHDAAVAAVYVTQFRRTGQTAAPLAQRLGLASIERPVSAAGIDTYAGDLAREILGTHSGRTVLVVGHSNTVPAIVRALAGHEIPAIEESEYENLFVVVIPASGEPRLLRTRYGAPDH